MKNFPGRTVQEITMLAVAIRDNSPRNANGGQYIDYVENVMIPAAIEFIDWNGDIFMESEGYSMSTIVNCAYKVAYMMEKEGSVDIT
jgi:hypothetical protein